MNRARILFLRGAFAVLFACAFCLMGVLVLGGCSSDGSSSSTKPVGLTARVVDSVGRSVEVPVPCARIAALDSFAGEALVMVGAGPLMVAAPGGVASDVVLREVYPALVDMPAPMSGGTINIESLSALKPDVVLIKASLYRSAEELAKLDKLKIPYLVVEYATIDEQITALESIGSLFPSEQAARMGQLVDAYRTGVARVEACAKNIPEGQRVRVYHAINQAVLTDGSSSIGADWITRTGAINVSASEAATAEQGDYRATLEQVFVWDPDVVICNEASTADYLLADSKWTGLRAVVNKQVYAIPIGATRWGQRGSVETWFAMMWLGTTVYPDAFSSIDLRSEVESFYEKVLGVEVGDELYRKMLSGKDMRKRPTGEHANS